MVDLRLALATAGVMAFCVTTASAEDVKKDAPKPASSQSAYTPKDKAGSASPATKTPAAASPDTGTADKPK